MQSNTKYCQRTIYTTLNNTFQTCYKQLSYCDTVMHVNNWYLIYLAICSTSNNFNQSKCASRILSQKTALCTSHNLLKKILGNSGVKSQRRPQGSTIHRPNTGNAKRHKVKYSLERLLSGTFTPRKFCYEVSLWWHRQVIVTAWLSHRVLVRPYISLPAAKVPHSESSWEWKF